MLRKSLNATAAAAAIALSLTACGGGGGGTPALPSTGAPTNNNPTSNQAANAALTIKIPARAVSSSSKRAQYISASTKSMTIGLVSGSKTTQLAEVDLTPSSKGCTPLAGGGLQCNVVFVGQAGTNTYTLGMYDNTGGKGNLLSSGKIPNVTLVAGQNTNVPIALDGVPASVAAVLGTGSLKVGAASTTSVTLVAKDSDGNIIVGPGGYSTPIKLAISGDKYKTLSLSETTVASPGDAVTLNYNGGSNVGATITPSIGSAAGTPATFNASGATMNIIPLYYDYNFNGSIYLWPYAVLGLANGTGAVEAETYVNGTWGYGIAIASPTSGIQTLYQGDTTNPYSVPTPTTTPGATIVNGMSQQLDYEEFEAYDDMAQNPTTGGIYYTGYYNATAPATGGQCQSGQSESSGTIGELNPTSGKLVFAEKTLKGYPGPIKVDSAGNVWWIEWTGTCNGTSILGSDTWAIGELTAGGTLKETPFSAAGLNITYSSSYVSDMSISADGSKMYISDYYNNTMWEIGTASLSSPTMLTLNNSGYAMSVATSSDDGTTAWSSDTDPNYNWYYGYVPGSKTFSISNVGEAQFPINYVYSYTMAYADGSFWQAEYPDASGASGIGRISGLSSGSPMASFYQAPSPENSTPQYPTSISAGGGYVWAVDDEWGNVDVMQYGAPSNGTISYNAVRRMAAMSTPVKRSMLSMPAGHHAPNARMRHAHMR